MMPDLSLAAQKISAFEGFSPTPYLDTAKIPTIGYGTIRYPNGKRVTLADSPITVEMGLVYLEHDLKDTAEGLWEHIERPPTMNQWAALLSITYNEGVHAITNSSLLAHYNMGQLDVAANCFLQWCYEHLDGKLVEVPGLLHRRQQERTLFLTLDHH